MDVKTIKKRHDLITQREIASEGRRATRASDMALSRWHYLSQDPKLFGANTRKHLSDHAASAVSIASPNSVRRGNDGAIVRRAVCSSDDEEMIPTRKPTRPPRPPAVLHLGHLGHLSGHQATPAATDLAPATSADDDFQDSEDYDDEHAAALAAVRAADAAVVRSLSLPQLRPRPVTTAAATAGPATAILGPASPPSPAVSTGVLPRHYPSAAHPPPPPATPGHPASSHFRAAPQLRGTSHCFAAGRRHDPADGTMQTRHRGLRVAPHLLPTASDRFPLPVTLASQAPLEALGGYERLPRAETPSCGSHLSWLAHGAGSAAAIAAAYSTARYDLRAELELPATDGGARGRGGMRGGGGWEGSGAEGAAAGGGVVARLRPTAAQEAAFRAGLPKPLSVPVPSRLARGLRRE